MSKIEDIRKKTWIKERKIPICRWIGEIECIHQKNIFCTAGFQKWKKCSDLKNPFKGIETPN